MSRELLKAIFYHQKTKKQTGFARNFLQPLIQVCRGTYIPYFRINATIFCCPLFFEEYLNPQVRINKMLNEYSVNYHTSISEATMFFKVIHYGYETFQNVN